MSFQLRQTPNKQLSGRASTRTTSQLDASNFAYLRYADPSFDMKWQSKMTSHNSNNDNNNNTASDGTSTSYFIPPAFLLLILILALIQALGFLLQQRRTSQKREKYQDLRLPPLRVLENEPESNRFAQYAKSPNRQNLKSRHHSSQPQQQQTKKKKQQHPGLKQVPEFPIRLETMKMLRIVGVRLLAYGIIQTQPRRIWISIDDQSLIWQSEFHTKIPNHNHNNNKKTEQSSLLFARGPIHRLDWGDIKFIDVGKHTDALKHHATAATVHENLCFSILTLNGSLDLQAKSQLERDSLVSCLGSMLDEYNGGEDWRASYQNNDDYYDNNNNNNRDDETTSMVSESLFSTTDSLPSSMCPYI